MSQGQGVISSNDLMHRLVQAKKVMNKVDSGNYEKGNVNEAMIMSSPEDLMNSQQQVTQPTQVAPSQMNFDKRR